MTFTPAQYHEVAEVVRTAADVRLEIMGRSQA